MVLFICFFEKYTDLLLDPVKESASLFLLKLFRSQTIKTMQNAMEFKANIMTSMLSGLGSSLPFRVKNNLKEILTAILQDDSS